MTKYTLKGCGEELKIELEEAENWEAIAGKAWAHDWAERMRKVWAEAGCLVSAGKQPNPKSQSLRIQDWPRHAAQTLRESIIFL